MTIRHTIPTNDTVPGTRHEIDVVSAAIRAQSARTENLLIVGMKLSGGTGVNGTPYEIFSAKDGDTYFGVGSELALSIRAALKAAKYAGASPRIFAASLADPAGTAAARSFTLGGTSTEAGEIVVTIAGRTIRAYVASGTAAAAAATALEAAIDAYQSVEALPVTAGVAGAVVTTTHRQTGVNGNDLKCAAVFTPAGLTNTVSNTAVAGVGAVTIATVLDLMNDRHYHAVAIANHTSTDLTALAAYITTQSLPQTKRWPFCFLAETASLSTGNSLATTANNKQIVVINAELFPNTPGELAAYVACLAFGKEQPNYNFDGDEMPGIFLPEPTDVPTYDEKKTAINSGATILSVNDNKTAAVIVRMVTTMTSVSSVATTVCLDLGNFRSIVDTVLRIDAKWNLWQQKQENKRNTEGARRRCRTCTLAVLKEQEEREVLQNVDAHLAELLAERQGSKLVVGIPASVVQALHNIIGVTTLFLEE
jgi:phage tail sheath gpL-like